MAAGPPGTLAPLVAACRPRQWTKNLLVFAAPLFAFRFEADVWLPAAGALVAFCLISSAINAGLVSVPAALRISAVLAAVLAVVSLSLAARVALSQAGVVLLYGLVQVGYCLQLKGMPLPDLFCIASGFLLRAIAGAVAALLAPPPWFLLTVGLLALFLAIEKRQAELRLESTVATSAFMSYSLWAAGPGLRGAPTSWMLLTVPCVLVGIFRYQQLSDPEEAERRRGIKFTFVGWLVTSAVIGPLSRAS